MCRDLREICVRYEDARIGEKAVTEATALRLEAVEAEFAEAVREHDNDSAEIRGERNRASLRTERALLNLKEALAEVGGAVICEGWCYSLINGQIHRQRWQMAAAVAKDHVPYLNLEGQHEEECDEDKAASKSGCPKCGSLDLREYGIHDAQCCACGAVFSDFSQEDDDSDGDMDQLWPEGTVIDATSLGKAVINHLQKTDMAGSLAGLDDRIGLTERIVGSRPEVARSRNADHTSNGKANPLTGNVTFGKAEAMADGVIEDVMEHFLP